MDIPGRSEWERRMARHLSGLTAKQMRDLFDLLGDPPNINNVPPSFWDETGREIADALVPLLEELYLEQAAAMMEGATLDIDWTLVNESAAKWASQHAGELEQGLSKTSQTQLAKKVEAFFEEGWTIGKLKSEVSDIFSVERIDNIAVTEVTRAAVEGERAIVKELAKQGVRMEEVWQTSNDGDVCVVCEPRNGKKYGDGWTDYPPAHSRCRCWVNHEYITTVVPA